MPIVPRAEIRQRLDQLVERAVPLEREGLPFPMEQVRDGVERAIGQGDLERAGLLLRQSESLLEKAAQDWTWLRELLRRADEMRALAERLGVDVGTLDQRVGHPREQLMSAGLSKGSIERAAASASLALAVLNDTIPKFCMQDARRLGERIRAARDRGEEVDSASRKFREFLTVFQTEPPQRFGPALLELRHAVGRIPPAPLFPSMRREPEEEEILVEARNLARRLQRIRGKARDAQSAARLMAQVRAALSEDRRYGTAEEEIEALWTEVDRLTRERTERSVPSPSDDDLAMPIPPPVGPPVRRRTERGLRP